jgi:photosystem II stability/assembly factor-like uncharacterized protein
MGGRGYPHPQSRILLFMKVLATLAAIFLLPAIAQSQVEKSGPLEMQDSGTTASLRGIHAVGGGVAWASGTNGTVLRTEDSGYMWQSCAMPPGAEKLDFRGIWAWDANTAIVMSSGPGDQSRLYKTTDGCSHWALLYTNPDKDGFWDAMVFAGNNPSENGWVLGDPVAGSFKILSFNTDGKFSSGDVSAPSAPPGSGAFAASNSSLALNLRPGFPLISHVWFGAGGKAGAMVYVRKTRPAGWEKYITSWTAVHVPLASGTDAAGVFSLAFRDDQHGMAVGGDYTKPNESTGTAAWTADGGQHWAAAAKPPHGYRSAVAWDAEVKAWIAAGTNGSDISYDDGKTWQPLDDGNWNALSLPWIVGPKGRIAKLGALPKK